MRRLHLPSMAAFTALTSIVAVAPAQTQALPATTTTTTEVPLCQAGITKGARDAIVALQTAVVAKDATIATRLAAAQAVAKSNDDRCFIGQLQQKAAVDAKNYTAVPAALEAQLASGGIPATRIAGLYEDLGQIQYRAGALDSAASAYERAVAIDAKRSSAVLFLAETRAKQNRIGEALPLYRRAIAMETAAGRPADSKWYGRALTVAHGARNPLAYDIARDWVTAYPTAANWRDAIRIYANISSANDDMMVDLYRLQRVTRSLAGEADYVRYAQYLINKGLSGEAKAMLDEGFASKAVDRSLANVKTVYAAASAKAAGDRASLDGEAKTALAGPTARQALVLGDAYYGYGDYAKAAAMYRAAQGKTGADANLINLRIGMALAASGDKAGARSAFALVGGTRADIGRYWTTYASTRN